ncbi:PREDICTED: uncharacterized protein LOC109240536 [Nicotiana attenuata]|uniref:uncharacterized protein LOC109240536 n=1 Tax=Nicotiana attenuata TaxID=49451 RepID=UPI000904AE24|nr:PREDICTED: uncharacterized protein LOC109240536 [Nicotiana attenuata]
MVSESISGVWTLYTNATSNVKGSRLRIVLITPSAETLRQAIRTVHLTNNEAEYEALIAGLELARGLDSEVIEIKCDLQLVVNQVYGIFDTKEEHMQQYVKKVQALLARFWEWSITHIPREDNTEVDALANLGSSTEIKEPESVTVVQLMNSVLDTDGYYEVNSTGLVWDWRNEIIDYLEHKKFPEDPKASWALRNTASRKDNYIENLSKDHCRVLGTSEANYVMKEVHEGICGNHSGADSLVLKFVRAGYYCPRMEQDAKAFVRKCDKFQHYAPLVHQPLEPLYSILSPWSFMKWGMDIVGPLPSAPRKVRNTKRDCVQKWATVYRCKSYKVPRRFENKEDHIFTLSSKCKRSSGIKEQGDYSKPQKKVEAAKGNWPEELPGVLWAYRTTAKSSKGETPFSLVYGAEPLIPVEVGEPTLRYFQADEESNNEAILINLELLEETRDLAHVRMATQNQRMKRSPMLEGPYRISAVTEKGSYELENQNGDKLLRNWNVAHLKRYYC